LPPPPPPPVVVERKPAPVVPLEPALPIITSGAPSGKDVYRHVLKSVAWILVRQGTGDGAMMGTGTLVDRTNGLILTNDHVIRGGSEIVVFFPNYHDGQVIAERDNYLKNVRRQDVIRGQVVAKDSARDLALVQIQQIP